MLDRKISNKRKVSLKQNIANEAVPIPVPNVSVKQDVLPIDVRNKINPESFKPTFNSPSVITLAGLDKEREIIKKNPAFNLMDQKKQELILFIQQYWPNISKACYEAEVTKKNFKEFCEADENFTQMIELIKELRHDFLEARMYDEAITEADDRRFILKHGKPEKYGDKPLVQIQNFNIPQELLDAIKEEKAKKFGLSEDRIKLINAD